MMQFISKAVVWALCLVYSAFAAFRLFLLYVTKFPSKPWKPKDRPNPPACLSDPIYGTHKYAKVNGIRLHYVEAGDHSKPLMVLVHGFPEFWFSWRHQIVEFSKDYWTVAIDLRGYNLSDRPKDIKDYKLPKLVEDLRALIEYLDRKQCILVCHDWGAIIGWNFVAKYKHMVQKYIMMGAPPRRIYRKLLQSTLEQFKKSWYIFFFQMPILPEWVLSADDMAIFKLMSNGKKTDENVNDDVIESYKFVFSRPSSFTGGINYYRAMFSSGLKIDTRKSEQDTMDGTDGMFMLGDGEKYISQKSLALTLKEYPKIRVEMVPNANHFVQHHNPTATNELMRNFLGPVTNYSVENYS